MSGQPDKTPRHTGMEYKVDLDIYSGPLDLLLFLIKRAEIDIWDIPVAAIADQFIHQVRQLQNEEMDLESMGEFLVLAATLLQIKSEMLLPPAPTSDDRADDDPRLGLVRQLIEYKRYRDLALVLDRQADAEALCHRRPDGLLADLDGPDVYLDEVQPGDLFWAFLNVAHETQLNIREILYDERPIEDVLDELRQKLTNAQWQPLTKMVEDSSNRLALVTVFWAMLEMVRRQEARVQQRGTNILLRLTTDEEREAAERDNRAANERRREATTEAESNAGLNGDGGGELEAGPEAAAGDPDDEE